MKAKRTADKWMMTAMAIGMVAVLLTGTVATVGASSHLNVEVSDQEVMDGTVVVDQVMAEQAGWLVIHADQDGAPGPVIGYAMVEQGENMDVQVEIDTAQATSMLYAMLHEDTGEMGSYDFPDGDAPVMMDGSPVSASFTATDVVMMAEEMTMEMEDEAMADDDMADMAPTPEPELIMEEEMPTTGGDTAPWASIALISMGAVVVLASAGLTLMGATRKR